jgi:hypothetical protein
MGLVVASRREPLGYTYPCVFVAGAAGRGDIRAAKQPTFLSRAYRDRETQVSAAAR